MLNVRIITHYNRDMDYLESYNEQNEIIITPQNRIEILITYHFW